MFRLRLALALTIALAFFLIAATPSFALLGAKTWSADPAIEAEWLFPASGPARVMWMFMAQPGRLELRVWARDLDYWTATDDSNYNPFDTQRSGYEADTLTYTWVAERGTIEGSGPSVAYVAKDKNTGFNLTPGPDNVTVTIDDVASLPPGDCGSRNDSQPFESQLCIVVDNPGGPFRIVRILVSGTTGAPATSGYNQQSDPNQRAYANFSIGFLTLIRATTDFGTGTGNGTISLLVPPDETHEMHTVTVRLPPNGTPLDEKQANFGLYFHHETLNETQQQGSAPNWFEHYKVLVGAQDFIYQQNLADGQGDTPGEFDWKGKYGNGRGKVYMGAMTVGEVEWRARSGDFLESTIGWSPLDIFMLWGIDSAGMVAKHELRHKWLWERGDAEEGAGRGNWGGYTQSQIGGPPPEGAAFWPYDSSSGKDNDEDGVKNQYEENHPPFNKNNRYVLNILHNGETVVKDFEFDAQWFGSREWVEGGDEGSVAEQDWSDHGRQTDQY